MRSPAPSEQINFLRDLQRLLDEGQFTATYKFALLIVLSELAVEVGNDSGEPLRLSLRDIAERFIRLYWGHARPFPYRNGRSGHGLLSQNHGQNISLLRLISKLQNRCDSFAKARNAEGWASLLSESVRILRGMPLLKLQTLRGGSRNFLYENTIEDGCITLKSGIAQHFRHFQVMVQLLVQGAWVRHIRGNPRNSTLLGETLDLETFLFGSARAPYPRVKVALAKLQKNRCFYCERSTTTHNALDHFIPWSKYPVDLGHNFVLACRACNSSKSDLLAESQYADRWRERNLVAGSTLVPAFTTDSLHFDLNASSQIANWAYSRAVEAGADFWTHR